MQQLKTQTVYTEVPMQQIKAGVHCFAFGDQLYQRQTDVYIFTKEELEERDRERDQRIAGEAWTACKRYTQFNTDASGNPIPDKSQYLLNLKTK